MTDHTRTAQRSTYSDAPLARAAVMGETIPCHERATAVFPLPDGGAAVCYHATYVAQVGADGRTYTLQHGGYMSATTRRRMNAYTPANVTVYQRAKRWYVDVIRPGANTVTIPYGEGMRFDAVNGECIDAGDRDDATYDRDALRAACDAARD